VNFAFNFFVWKKNVKKQKNKISEKLAKPIMPVSFAKTDKLFPSKSFDFKLKGRMKIAKKNQRIALFTISNRLKITKINGRLNKKCSESVTKKFGVNARNKADHSTKSNT
jgi:hypothetical protein